MSLECSTRYHRRGRTHCSCTNSINSINSINNLFKFSSGNTLRLSRSEAPEIQATSIPCGGGVDCTSRHLLSILLPRTLDTLVSARRALTFSWFISPRVSRAPSIVFESPKSIANFSRRDFPKAATPSYNAAAFEAPPLKIHSSTVVELDPTPELHSYFISAAGSPLTVIFTHFYSPHVRSISIDS